MNHEGNFFGKYCTFKIDKVCNHIFPNIEIIYEKEPIPFYEGDTSTFEFLVMVRTKTNNQEFIEYFLEDHVDEKSLDIPFIIEKLMDKLKRAVFNYKLKSFNLCPYRYY